MDTGVSSNQQITQHCCAIGDDSAQITAQHYESDASATGLPMVLNKSQGHVCMCVCVSISNRMAYKFFHEEIHCYSQKVLLYLAL